MGDKPLKIFISVGEESADLHASKLCATLRAMHPDIELFGFGGQKMAAEGVEIVYPLPDLALIGFVEVIKKLHKIMQVKNLALQCWEERKPNAIILVDYPGFHLRLARHARDRNIPVYYFIAPQAWAWKEGRVKTIRETIRRLMVIFPFEEAYFRHHGIATDFVGHPLTERIPAPALDGPIPTIPESPVIGLMPGSRKNELHYMLPSMIEAAALVREQMPSSRFLFPLAQALPEEVLQPFGVPDWIEVCRNRDYLRRREMTLAWTSSGTATVENALLGIPMAVVYRTGSVNMFIGRRLVRIPYIGMVNLIAQKGICPEFIQEQCQPKTLARFTFELLQSPQRYHEMKRDLIQIREKLGERHASEEAAKIVVHDLLMQTT